MADKKQKYNHKEIEPKWQDKWAKEGFYSPKSMKDLGEKQKFYNLWMFPYPSAEGLHAGHAFASTGSDIYGRYQRMKGRLVFQPIGYDSFGLHSENFAIKIGEHPHLMLERTTKNYERQLKSLGHSYDWKRTVTTSDPDYYRWTQWLFVKLFENGLAYQKVSPVNWCPSCKTVIADEQVIEGKCERCSTLVTKKDLKQWFFRITDYAEKLLQNLSNGKIDWSQRVVNAQKNWIGKKEWIDITYKVEGPKGKLNNITVSTTRPDTNFGATFIVLAPEHPFVTEENIPGDIWDDVKKYIDIAKQKTDEERLSEGKTKTGVNTGLFAVNPLNGKKLPIWISDFVLTTVGTGAVVGVPGHDRRDFEFAKEFGIEVLRVIKGPGGETGEITSIDQVQEDEGELINSDFLNGIKVQTAISKMMDYLESQGYGKRTIRYHLRDWLISRQRYWGPPIPMIYCEKCAKEKKSFFDGKKDLLHQDQSDWDHFGWYPCGLNDLPELPMDITDFKPKGEGKGPLANHPEFFETACPVCGAKAERETDVSDTFVDSAWYFLRYPTVGSENEDKMPWDNDITKTWLPVDLYFGGAEHSVLHLMYARFVTMVLSDIGLLEFEEPFPKFFAHGLMIKGGAKMSKSRGNVVNPDEYIEKYGADTLRMYLMFMGPMDGSPDFRDEGIEGMRRFVVRVWDLLANCDKVSKTKAKELEKPLIVSLMTDKVIKKVTNDIENFRYNTAIATLMTFVNDLEDIRKSNTGKLLESELGVLLHLIAPFMPHMAEEIWMDNWVNESSIHESAWPEYDPEKLIDKMVKIPVQVNGKLRQVLELEAKDSSDKDYVINKALEEESIDKWTRGKKVINKVFVPGKLLNIVTD